MVNLYMSIKKCKICNKPFADKKALVRHIDKSHSSQIPEEWTASRFENYLRTNKTHGTCIVCKEDTTWNNVTEKYCRLCGKESCRNSVRKLAEENLMKSKGITHSQMLSDPDFQRKMVYSKKTSGIYRFNDDNMAVDIHYDSSYGKDFLEMLEHFMGFNGCDIIGPSPNTYVYKYDGKNHFYIPDFYIPSLNLEVEIKDGGDNPNKHPKIQNVDKVKESLKDEAMSKSKVNYVKVSNKNYATFFKMLFILKEKGAETSRENKSEFSYVVESTDVTLDSAESMVQWLYRQLGDVSSDSDFAELDGKIEHMSDVIRTQINDDDISYSQRKDLQKKLSELVVIRYELLNRVQ